MRLLFQTSWHGIPFSSLPITSRDAVADPSFYEAFYTEFFKKYRQPEDLDPQWLQHKRAVVDALFRRLTLPTTGSILSISCGLGVMEMELLKKGFTQLEVTEGSAAPLAWLKEKLPAEKIHIGLFPQALPVSRSYDLILLSSLDYLFDERGLIRLLQEVRHHLTPKGRCVLMSWSVDETTSRWENLKGHIRKALPFLDRIHVMQPAWFWGYARRRMELVKAFQDAGLSLSESSLIPHSGGAYAFVGHASLTPTKTP